MRIVWRRRGTDLDGIFDGHGEVDGGGLGLRDGRNGSVFESRLVFTVVRRTMVRFPEAV